MNSSYPYSAAAEEQAALWAARLDGSTLTAADRNALDAWLASNPAHRTLLSSYCQFSADLEQQLPALVEAGAVAMPAKKKAAPSGHRSATWFAGLALAAAALVMFGVWLAQPSYHPQTIATAAARRQSVTLADGTRVELNARTQLLVENGPAERRVRLVDGEAFFQVSKDKSRPFIVETPSGSVHVTGTTFSVRCENAAALDVLVVEGSVLVSTGKADAAPVSLGANDHLSTAKHPVSVEKLSTAAVDEALAWRKGQIVTTNMPLADVFARFERYHGRTITVSPAVAAANLHLGGVRSLDDADGFLADVEASQSALLINSDAHGVVHVKLRSEP